MPYVEANGVCLYYERHGTGFPILIIPGLPAIVSDCLPLVDALRDRFDVIVYDNRGSGNSDKPDEPYSVEGFARDGAALLGALRIPRSYVLGFSLGGMIAQQLALDFPQMVPRLVLACTHAGLRYSPPSSRDVAAAFQIQTDNWGERIRALAPYAFAPGYPERDAEKFSAFISKKSGDEQPCMLIGGSWRLALPMTPTNGCPRSPVPRWSSLDRRILSFRLRTATSLRIASRTPDSS